MSGLAHTEQRILSELTIKRQQLVDHLHLSSINAH